MDTPAGIPLREFFRRLGLEIHDMSLDGVNKVDPDTVRVFGFTPALEDGSPDHANFREIPHGQ